MNVQITHNGSDISNSVISYTREHKICTGIGTLQLVVDPDSGITFDTWDYIDIYEETVKVARYYINTVSLSQEGGSYVTVDCQDNSKRIIDYFVTDTYYLDDVGRAKTWINTFLGLAGVSASFNVSGLGGYLAPGASLGMTSVYDQVMQLLQISGWYMKFNSDGTASIGQIESTTHGIAASFSDDDITSIEVRKNDKMLRNRAVVWGGTDFTTGNLIISDIERNTPWNYDSDDIRTVAMGNSTIPDTATSKRIANLLLNEFARLTVEKTLNVPGAFGLELGDYVDVDTDIFGGIGQITSLSISMSADGFITSIALDERCPRLFAFWYPYENGFPNEYVYIGTEGDGVWRKDLANEEIWYDYSNGLTNKNITDLHINNGVAVCLDTDGAAYRAKTSYNKWYKLATSSLTTIASGIVYGTLGDGFKARACVVDSQTNNIKLIVDTYSGINYLNYLDYTSTVVTRSGESNSWILEYSPTGSLLDSKHINYAGITNISSHDIETDGVNNISSLSVLSSGIVYNQEVTADGPSNIPNANIDAYIDLDKTYESDDIYYQSYSTDGWYRTGAAPNIYDVVGYKEVSYIGGGSTSKTLYVKRLASDMTVESWYYVTLTSATTETNFDIYRVDDTHFLVVLFDYYWECDLTQTSATRQTFSSTTSGSIGGKQRINNYLHFTTSTSSSSTAGVYCSIKHFKRNLDTYALETNVLWEAYTSGTTIYPVITVGVTPYGNDSVQIMGHIRKDGTAADRIIFYALEGDALTLDSYATTLSLGTLTPKALNSYWSAISYAYGGSYYWHCGVNGIVPGDETNTVNTNSTILKARSIFSKDSDYSTYVWVKFDRTAITERTLSTHADLVTNDLTATDLVLGVFPIVDDTNNAYIAITKNLDTSKINFQLLLCRHYL